MESRWWGWGGAVDGIKGGMARKRTDDEQWVLCGGVYLGWKMVRLCGERGLQVDR